MNKIKLSSYRGHVLLWAAASVVAGALGQSLAAAALIGILGLSAIYLNRRARSLAQPEDVVTELYHQILQREPDLEGLATKVKTLEQVGISGETVLQLVSELTNSTEFKKKIGAISSLQSEDVVTELYHQLLQREPDPEGLATKVKTLEQVGISGETVLQLVIELSGSEEFQITMGRYLGDEADLKQDFSSVSEEILEQLWNKTAEYWRSAASEPSEIYYSVLTAPEYEARSIRGKDTQLWRRFMDSGEKEANRFYSKAVDYGLQTEAITSVLDFGCGVGRIACHLPDAVKHITCADFSPAHLQECESNLKKLRLAVESTHEFLQLDRVSDLNKLQKKYDLVYSLTVLQHSTPPVMYAILKALLGSLGPGGVAIIQLPIFQLGYHFSISEYLASSSAGSKMEMHCLPVDAIWDAASAAGVGISRVEQGGGNCGPSINDVTVVFKKAQTGLP